MNASEIHKKLQGTYGFFIAWMLLPILPFLILSPFVSYSTRIIIPFFVLAGFICLKSRIAASLLVVALTACSFLMFFVTIFRLSFEDTLNALLRDSDKIQLLADPLYASVLCAGVLSIGGILYMAWKYRPKPHTLKALGLMYLLIIADGLVSTDFSYAFGKQFSRFSEGESRVSAATQSGFRETVLAKNSAALLVIIEAQGRIEDSALEREILAPVLDLETHEVTTGHIQSFGSTTAAEIRELCDISGTHGSILGRRIELSNCLPRILSGDDRESVAIHGFRGSLFERASWYPELGFSRSLFGYDAVGETKNLCSSVFRGPCDFEVVQSVENEIIKARQSGKAPLIYWLTLNSHIPAQPHESLEDVFSCHDKGGIFGDSDVCALAIIWHAVYKDIARLAVKYPGLDILIVGDHPPPVFSRKGKALFYESDVPWVRLAPRE